MQRAIPSADRPPLLALPRFFIDPLSALDRAREAGNVSSLGLGFIDAVTLHHPEFLDHVFRAHQKNYTKGGPYWSSVREMLGNGLPVSDGEIWRNNRRLMQPQFNRNRVEEMVPLMVDALVDTLDWNDIDESWSVRDIGARMPHLTMNVASALLLGRNTSTHRARLIASEIDYAQRHLFYAMLTHRLPRWLPLPGRRRFEESINIIHSEVQQIIDGRRREADLGDDLLALLIAATDEQTGMGLSDAQLLDETLSLFLAGYETTSAGLQWCVALLAQHPEVWGRLREECEAVLGERNPVVDDLPRLQYARWVMQEALRLYPPGWWLPRVALEDDEIGDYAIPRGTIVAPVIYTVQRHPEIWDDPSRFDPERFDSARASERHPLAWCPFGAGPRKCIGQALALVEAALALAMLTQRYDIASSGHTPRPEVKVTLRPADGVRVRIRRRPAK